MSGLRAMGFWAVSLALSLVLGAGWWPTGGNPAFAGATFSGSARGAAGLAGQADTAGPGNHHHNQPGASSRNIIIFGLDETGSYSLRNRAVALIQSVIAGLKPRDVMYLRMITASSFTDDCSVFRLEVPAQDCRQPENKFNQRARAEYRRCLRQVQAVKAQAMAMVARLEPQKSGRTDLWGFLSAAAQRLESEGKAGDRRCIVVCSDMVSNVKRDVAVDLSEAEFFVCLWQVTEDPAAAQRLQNYWRRVLVGQAKAKSVRFVSPDQKVEF